MNTIGEEHEMHVPVRVHADRISHAEVRDETRDVQGAINPLLLVHRLLLGRYLWAVLLGMVGLIGGGLAGYFSTRPVYESVGVIEVSPTVRTAWNEKSGIIPMFDAYVDSQVALIKSDRVIGKSMESAEWKKFGRGMSQQAVANFNTSLTVIHARASQLIQVAFDDRDPEAARVAAQAVIDAYMVFDRDKGRESFNGEMKVYNDDLTKARGDLKGFNDQMDAIAKEVGSPKVGQIHDYKLDDLRKLETELKLVQMSLASADTNGNPNSVRGTAENIQNGEAGKSGQTSIAGDNDRSVDGTKLEPTGPDAPISAPILPVKPVSVYRRAAKDPQLRDYLRQQGVAESNLEILKRRYGANYPGVRDAEAEVERTTSQVENYLEEVARADAEGNPLAADDNVANLKALRIREHNLRDLYEAAKKETFDLGRKATQVAGLERDAAVAQKKIDELEAAVAGMYASAGMSGRVNKIGSPDRPLVPVKDKRAAFGVAGALGCSALGVGIIIMLGLVNPRLADVGDAHDQLCRNVPMLGILPSLPEDMSDPDQAAIAAHSVHQIRTMLQITCRSTGGKAFAVTSAAAGDGKTSLTLALGMSFAACGARTLLIDCDMIGGGLTSRTNRMVRPKLGRILRREGLVTDSQTSEALGHAARLNQKIGMSYVELGYLAEADVIHALDVQKQSVTGLLDVLGGDSVDQCVTGTGVPGLFILPLGGARPRHVGQLSPIAMRRMLDEARELFDTVLIDTGPILGSLEAAVAAPEVDGVVMTVSRGEQRPLATRSLEHLVQLGARVAGVVFNRAAVRDLLTSRYTSIASARVAASVRAQSIDASASQDTPRFGPVASAVALGEREGTL